MTLNIPISPETAARLREQAAAAGKDLETFVREILEQEIIHEGRDHESESMAEALAELDALRPGNRLNGMTIRQLIEEGRRL